MKKKLQLLALVAFLGVLGLSACSESVEPILVDDQELEENFDPRSEDEKDSIIDPFGN